MRTIAMLSTPRNLFPRRGAFQLGNIELFHLQHRLHRPARLLRVLVAEQFAHHGWQYLPREAEFVLEPAARTFLAAARSEFGPEVINLILILAHDLKRNRLGELEHRAAVERGEVLTGDF